MESLPARAVGGLTITNGVKTAAIVIILGVFAAVIDQSVTERHEAPVGAAPMPAADPAPLVGFALPPELRPNSGDVSAPTATF